MSGGCYVQECRQVSSFWPHSFVTKSEFSGGSAGMRGSAEAVRVFGGGSTVWNLHSSGEVKSAASLGPIAKSGYPLRSIRLIGKGGFA